MTTLEAVDRLSSSARERRMRWHELRTSREACREQVIALARQAVNFPELIDYTQKTLGEALERLDHAETALAAFVDGGG